ncbi:MAG: hypothetical protein Q8R91_04280 [Candidatus Omnitrophota bacterium]|nr:hypothetical protein [Candidatus Omnitrophota bacterium]
MREEGDEMVWRNVGTRALITELVLGTVLMVSVIALWGQTAQPRSCEEDRLYWQEYTRELAQDRARLEQKLVDTKLLVHGLQARVTQLQQALTAAKVQAEGEKRPAPEQEPK